MAFTIGTYLLVATPVLICFCYVNSQGVTLTRTSGFEFEGHVTTFKCRSSVQRDAADEFAVWLLDDIKLQDIGDSYLNITLYRNNTGSTLKCVIHPYNTNATWKINVMTPPKSVTLDMNSTLTCDSDCLAEVTIGHQYRFTCNVSDSNPASNITWLFHTKTGRDTNILRYSSQETETEDGNWETSSQMHQEIFTIHRSSSIVCRVLFPDSNIYKEIAMKLIVNEVQALNEDPINTTVVVAVIIPMFAVTVACLVIAFVCKLRQKSRHREAHQERSAESFDEEDSLASEKDIKTDCSFPRSKITLQQVLGSGHFGQVYKATAEGILREGVMSDVAVKVLKKSATDDVITNFEKEIKIHNILKEHPNVVTMLGYCTETEPFCIILEYLDGGNLQHCLREKKGSWKEPAVEGDQPACPFQLLTFAFQIASGMEYLSSMGCVHRDLATRNILLNGSGEDLVCKLSDFGLARDVSETDQYEQTSMGLIPVRWLAIESLTENIYTTMSDVWSFGVLLWEIVTLGAHPYHGMHPNDVIDSIVQSCRLPSPAHCSDELYELMDDVWQETPSMRPTFTDLKRKIEMMIPDAPIHLDMEHFEADKYK